MRTLKTPVLFILSFLFVLSFVFSEQISSTDYNATLIVNSMSGNMSSSNYTATIYIDDVTGVVNSSDYEGSFGSAYLLEINTIPIMLNSTIIPSKPFSYQNLTGFCNGTDNESVNLTYYYKWYKNDILISTDNFSINILNNSFYEKDDEIILSCIANDDVYNSTALNSSVATILNTPPVMSDSVIIPQNPLSNQTLIPNCTATDFDGDGLNYSTTWYVNDSIVLSGFDLNLTSSYFSRSDVIILMCEGFDGTNYSNKLNSSSVTISNTPPELINISFTGIYPEQQLNGSCDVFDYDNDSINKEYKWYVDDLLVSTSQNLSKIYTMIGDNVIFSCKFNDSINTSVWYNTSKYKNEYCRQDFANVSTSCGGLDTGSYQTSGYGFNNEDNLYDGDWSTYTYTNIGPYNGTTYKSNLYINYTKISDNATWQVKYGTNGNVSISSYVYNHSLPDSCMVNDTIQLRLESTFKANLISLGCLGNNNHYCYNSTNEWQELDFYRGESSDVACNGEKIYEEAMFWNEEVEIENHGIISYNDLDDNAGPTTSIGSDVIFSGNVELYDNVSLCQIIVQPVNSSIPFDIVNITNNGTTDINFTSTLTLSSMYTSEYDNVSWKVSCNDTSGNYQNSSLSYFTVYDLTKPDININGSKVFVNGTVIDNVVRDEVEMNITFIDPNLFQVSVNITCEESGNIYYYENLSLNNSIYFFNDNLSIDGYVPQKCYTYISASDDHTDEYIPEYNVIIRSNIIEYVTDNGLIVTIESEDVVTNIDTNKLTDRYNFEFDYSDSKLIRKYNIKTDGVLYLRKNTIYPGHFVAWNPKTKTGNWVDFALPNSQDYEYIINKINSNEYEVIIIHKILLEENPNLDSYTIKETETWFDVLSSFFISEKPLDEKKIIKTDIKYLETNSELDMSDIVNDIGIVEHSDSDMDMFEENYGISNIKFNSIGGTNIQEVQTYFYIGGVFNISSNNQYNDSAFTGYTVNITNSSGYSRIEFFNVSTNNIIENVSVDTYNIEITHPKYVSQTTTEIMQAQYDECEQILANESNLCGGLGTGDYMFSDVNDFINVSNIFDDNLSSYAVVSSFNYTQLYINYTIPSNITFAGWQVTAFGESSSVEIPLDTDSKSILQLRVSAKSGTGNNNIRLQEYNGTVWENLTYLPTQIYDSEIFDERIIWYNQTENVVDVLYNTSQSIITFFHRNIKSGDTVDNYTIEVKDALNNTAYYNVTDGSSGLTLPLNANITYNITFIKDGFPNQTNSYVFDYQEQRSIDIYLSYVINTRFINEDTLETFNFNNTVSAEVLVKCTDRTERTELDNSTNEIVVNCDYINFKFVLEYAGGSSYYRTIIVPFNESFNETFYLIDISETPFVYGSFIADDLLQNYENISIWTKKQIPGETVVIQSDFVDIESKVGYYLIENEEYIIEVHSDNQPIQIIGDYGADVGEEKVISLYDVNLESDPVGFYNNVETTIKMINVSSVPNVLFNYNDLDNLTESIQYKVYLDRINGTLFFESPVYTNVNELGNVFVPLTGYENRTVVGQIVVVHETAGTRQVAKMVNKNWILPTGIQEHLDVEDLNWIFIILISTIAIYSSARTNIISLVICGIGLLFVLFGWFELSISVLALAILMSILDFISKKRGRS